MTMDITVWCLVFADIAVPSTSKRQMSPPALPASFPAAPLPQRPSTHASSKPERASCLHNNCRPQSRRAGRALAAAAAQGRGALPRNRGLLPGATCGAAQGGGFTVHCSRPGCGATTRVLPQQLGLEPVTLEAVTLEAVPLEAVSLEPVTLEPVTLEAVSREELLTSDPALQSELPGMPSYPQVTHRKLPLTSCQMHCLECG